MKSLVRFELLSDVITGGVRTATNFLVSEEFISGAVLRAGFAADILLDCPYAGEVFEGKTNWVAFRGKEKCDGCRNMSVCKKFGEMTFSYLYPLDAVPAPFTLRKCKAGCNLPEAVMDTVAKSGRLVCPLCKEKGWDGRMQSATGFVNAKSGTCVKVERSVTTHTSIDAYTGTALNGSLFSIDAVRGGQIYYGIIDDCGTGMLAENAIVRVGKYSSSGFGKLRIISVKEYKAPDVIENVNKFCEKFGENKAAILFTSDAVLGLEKLEKTGKSLFSKEYLDIWQERIFGNDKTLKVEKVFAQNYCYSGYDTSASEVSVEGCRKEPRIYTQRGTSVLVSFTDKEAALMKLKELQDNGIGEDRDIGCGSVEVCGSLHQIGIMEAEND